MTLVKWIPQSSINNVFDDFHNFFQYALGNTDNFVHNNVPNANIKESDSEYCINLDLPGLAKDDVDVGIKNNVLYIKGKRSLDSIEESDNFIINESFLGEFKRSFKLPENILEEKITAKIFNGILKVSIPKSKDVISEFKKVKVS